MDELHQSFINDEYNTVGTSTPNPPPINGSQFAFYLSQLLLLLISLVAHFLAIITMRRVKREREMLDAADEYMDVHTLLFKALLRVDLSATLFFLCRALLAPTPLFSDNSFRCTVDSSSGIFFSQMSGLINILLFLERVLSLRTPYLYRRHATAFKAKIAVTCMVFFGLFVCLLPVFGFGSYHVEIDGGILCLSPGDVHLSQSKHHIHFTIVFLTVGFCIILSIVLGNIVVIYYVIRLRQVAPLDYANQVSIQPIDTANEHPGVDANNDLSDVPVPSLQLNDDKMSNGGNQRQNPTLKLAVKFSREVGTALALICVSIAYMISWIPLYVSLYIN